MAVCGSGKLWLGIGAVGVVVAFTTSGVGAVLPLLLLAACPLSMVLMAAGMAAMGRRGRETSSSEDDELVGLRTEVAALRERVGR